MATRREEEEAVRVFLAALPQDYTTCRFCGTKTIIPDTGPGGVVVHKGEKMGPLTTRATYTQWQWHCKCGKSTLSASTEEGEEQTSWCVAEDRLTKNTLRRGDDVFRIKPIKKMPSHPKKEEE